MRAPSVYEDSTEDAGLTSDAQAIIKDQERKAFFAQNPVIKQAVAQEAQQMQELEALAPQETAEVAQPSTLPTRDEVLARAARPSVASRNVATRPAFDSTGLAIANKGFEQMKQGEMMMAGAEAARLDQEALYEEEAANRVVQANNAVIDQQDRLLEKQREVTNKAMEFNEKMKERQIDTDRFWANKTTGQRSMLALGVFLMGVGGRDGLAQINTLIDRDIAAQKDALDRGLQVQNNMVSLSRQLYGDETAALDAAKAMALENINAKLKAKMATTKSPEVRAKALKAVGAIEVEQGKLLNNVAATLYDSQAKASKEEKTALPAEVGKRFDLMTSGLDAVKRMRMALERGDNTFTFLGIGDNDFTTARKYYIESFRANTGAAMPKEEVENYMSFVPKATDTHRIQMMKLDIAERTLSQQIRRIEDDYNRTGEKSVMKNSGIRFAEPK